MTTFKCGAHIANSACHRTKDAVGAMSSVPPALSEEAAEDDEEEEEELLLLLLP
jgi:hypothetical protein